MKKIACLLIALACIMALVGCGATNRAVRRAYTDARLGGYPAGNGDYSGEYDRNAGDFSRSRSGNYSSDKHGRVQDSSGRTRTRSSILPPAPSPRVTASVLPNVAN